MENLDCIASKGQALQLLVSNYVMEDPDCFSKDSIHPSQSIYALESALQSPS